MMGPTHALMGLGAGLGVGLVLNLSTPLLFIGCLVTAGAALGPDADHTKSTFRYCFGWIGRGITELVDSFSTVVYQTTKTSKDPNREGGHRTLTHTPIFQIVFGLFVWLTLAYELTHYIVVFMMVVLAMRALFSKGLRSFIPFYVSKLSPGQFRRGVLSISRLSAIGLGLIIPALQMMHYLPMFEEWQLALLVTIGGLVHIFGDWFTNSGVPLMWPIPINNQMWKRYRCPANFETGKDFEMNVIAPVLFMVVAAVFGLTIHSLL